MAAALAQNVIKPWILGKCIQCVQVLCVWPCTAVSVDKAKSQPVASLQVLLG